MAGNASPVETALPIAKWASMSDGTPNADKISSVLHVWVAGYVLRFVPEAYSDWKMALKKID